MEKITRSMIRSAEKVLADNGIDPFEVETVLQSLGYVLFDKELYSAQTEVIECTEIDPFGYERDHQELKRPTTIQYQVVCTSKVDEPEEPGRMQETSKSKIVGTFDCEQEAARKLEDYAKSFLRVQAGRSIRVAIAKDCLSADIVMRSAERGICIRRHLAVQEICV